MHQSFVTTAPPPAMGNSGDNFPSIKTLHCGDLLRVIAQLLITVNSTGVYLHNVTSPALTRHGGTQKVTTPTPHISPAIPAHPRGGGGQWLQMTGA